MDQPLRLFTLLAGMYGDSHHRNCCPLEQMTLITGTSRSDLPQIYDCYNPIDSLDCTSDKTLFTYYMFTSYRSMGDTFDDFEILALHLGQSLLIDCP